MKTRRFVKRSQSKRSQSKRTIKKAKHKKTRTIIKHWRNKTLKGGQRDSEGDLNPLITEDNKAIKRFVEQNPTYEIPINYYTSKIPLYVGSPEKTYNSAELNKNRKYESDIKKIKNLSDLDPNRIYQPNDRIDPQDKRDYKIQINEVLEQIKKEINEINERRNFLIKKIKDKKGEEDKLLSKLYNPDKKPTNKEKEIIKSEIKANTQQLTKAQNTIIVEKEKLKKLEEEYKEYEIMGLTHSDPAIKGNLNAKVEGEGFNRNSDSDNIRIRKKTDKEEEEEKKKSSNRPLYASQRIGEEMYEKI